jgi:hypothetical protein
MAGRLLFDNAEDVALAHDEVLITVERHFGAGVLAIDDVVIFLHRHLDPGAILSPTRPGRDDRSLLGLLLRRIRDVETAFGLLFGRFRLDDDAVAERSS